MSRRIVYLLQKRSSWLAARLLTTFPSSDNKFRLVPGEGVTIASESGKGWSTLRPGQKPVTTLKELISRSSQPRGSALDLFAGTFLTTKACFSLPSHRVFVGCELNKECYEIAPTDLVTLFALAVLTKKNDISLRSEKLAPTLAAPIEYKPQISEMDGRHLTVFLLFKNYHTTPSPPSPQLQTSPTFARAAGTLLCTSGTCSSTIYFNPWISLYSYSPKLLLLSSLLLVKESNTKKQTRASLQTVISNLSRRLTTAMVLCFTTVY